MNPCDNCKKKPNCPERCFPKMDYERGQKKRKRAVNFGKTVFLTREDAEKALEGPDEHRID